MSAGIVWYKMQPDSEIACAISDLLTNYCGSIKSHDVTVKPQNISVLMSKILSRSEAVIFIGGMDEIIFENNIVYLISHALGISLERGKHSRSKYVFDTLHSTRLPSLKGSVLFPTRFGAPEGILLMSGNQTVIVLPRMTRAAIISAVSMRRFLAPYVREHKSHTISELPEPLIPKDYVKFNRDHAYRKFVTREYSESGLNSVMQRAVSYARRKAASDDYDYPSYNNPAEYTNSESDYDADDEYYKKISSSSKVRNFISLVLVIGAIIAMIIMACMNSGGILLPLKS